MGSENTGWKLYAAIMLAIGGMFNVIDGLVGIYRENYFQTVTGGTVALPITDTIKTWSWVALVWGALMVAAGAAIVTGMMWARIVGVAAAGLNMILQFAYFAHFPLWSFTMLVVDFFVIYALVVHGAPVEAGAGGAAGGGSIDLREREPAAAATTEARTSAATSA